MRIGKVNIAATRQEVATWFGIWPMPLDYGDGPHLIGVAFNVGSRVVMFGWAPAMARVESQAWESLAEQLEWP